jgi:hypothetical protein
MKAKKGRPKKTQATENEQAIDNQNIQENKEEKKGKGKDAQRVCSDGPENAKSIRELPCWKIGCNNAVNIPFEIKLNILQTNFEIIIFV